MMLGFLGIGVGGLIRKAGGALIKRVSRRGSRRAITSGRGRGSAIRSADRRRRAGRSSLVSVGPSVALPRISSRGGGGRGRSLSTRSGSRSMVPQDRTPIGEQTDKLGRPLMVEIAVRPTVDCPAGYVKVTLPDGSPACMLKGPAKSAGLYKERAKAPISAGDWKKLKVAERVRKKAKKVAQTADLAVMSKSAAKSLRDNQKKRRR